MNGQNRADVKIGAQVSVVGKAEQRGGKHTIGVWRGCAPIAEATCTASR